MKLVKQKLIEVVDYSKGKKPKNLGDESPQRNLPYIDIKAFEKNIVNQYASEEKVNICKPDDSLVVWDGARFGLTGFGMSGAVGSTIMKLSPKSFINPKLLFLFLQSKYLEINKNPKGVGIPHVNPSFFWNIEITYPEDKESQQKIVDKIEELFSVIDSCISNLELMLKKIKIYRQSVINSVVEKKLNEATSISHVVNDIRYGTSKKCDYELGNVPVLRIPNINTESGSVDYKDIKSADFSSDELDKLALQEGDILLIRSNGSIDLVGKTAVFKKQDSNAYLFAGYLIRIRLDKDVCNPDFFNLAIRSSFLRSQIESKGKSTSGVNNINSKEVLSLLMPIPTLEEQNRIINIVKSTLSTSDELYNSLTADLVRCRSLKQSILKQAFEGKLI